MRCLALVLLAAFATAAQAQDAGEQLPSIYGMQRLAVRPSTKDDLRYVASYETQPGFDFLKVPADADQPVDLLVTADQAAEFKEALSKRSIPYKVITRDMSKAIRAEFARQKRAHQRTRRAVNLGQSINLGAFPRYDEIQSYLKHLAKTRSSFIEYFSIGESYEGRELGGVKFSSGGENKPVLLIDAGIHPREWIAPTTALYAIKQLAENVSNSYIFHDIDIYIIPLLNPDGYEYTHLSEKTRMWRKTRSDVPFSSCKGVDANRNFDIQWMSVGASDLPCSYTYAGPSAFSEPETRALRDFILSLRGRVKTYLSFHSFGNYLLHPWGFTSKLPKNAPILRCAAAAAENELSKVRGTHYQIGSSTNVLYPAAGGSDDWSMAIGGVELSYTVELPGGEYGFDPPPREIIPVGEETFEAIKVFAQYVSGDICQNIWY